MIIRKLYHLVNALVPGANADFFEDDYDLTVWRDARPMPTVQAILAAAPGHVTKLEREKIVNVKKTELDMFSLKRMRALDPSISLTVVDVLSRLAIPVTPVNARLVAIHQYARQVSIGFNTKTNQEVSAYDPVNDVGFPT